MLHKINKCLRVLRNRLKQYLRLQIAKNTEGKEDNLLDEDDRFDYPLF